MLLPLSARVRGAGLAVLALVGLAAAIAIANYERRTPRDETRATLVFRFALPLVACLVLLVASLLMVADIDEASFGPAIFIFLMLIVGTQNAWDMLIGSRDVAAGAAITRADSQRESS